MWLFEDEVYIENRVEIPSSPSNWQEIEELARQTGNLAKANQEIANSLNQDRITILNYRYAELTNKSRLLQVLKKYVDTYFSIIGNLNNNDLFKKFYSNPYNFMDCMMEYDLYFKLTDRINVNINSKNKKIIIFKEENTFNFDYPEYVPFEEGTVILIGDKYKSLLKDEILLKEYIKIVENIESISYHFFGNKNTSDVVYSLMKRNENYIDLYNTTFQYFFDKDLKKVEHYSKYRLGVKFGPHYTNVELKINV